MSNFYGEELNESDKQILAGIQNIQTNVTNETLELVFTFVENPIVRAGTYTRRLVLENANPVRYVGDEIVWASKREEGTKREEGLMAQLLTTTETAEGASSILEVVSEFINEIVPYSLEYFLGAIGDEEEEEEEEMEVEDEEEDEESASKKV